MLAKDPPHEAGCCYPAMGELKRSFRAAFPGLRACYEARTNPAAEGTVRFEYRIEEDGSVKRVCVEEGSTMDDEAAARCMAEVVRAVRFPAIGKEGRDLCGLILLHYPVVFEP